MEMNVEKQLIAVPASCEVLTRLDEQSVPIGLEYCGKICYKSENAITDESAPGFCTKIAEHGHNSVLEMRVKTFIVVVSESDVDVLIKLMPKYLVIDNLPSDDVQWQRILITGSIRAFREMAMMYPYCVITSQIAIVLGEQHAFLFADIKSTFRNIENNGSHVVSVSLKELEILKNTGIITPDVFLRHRHIAVKFIVNRAVTHEIVRHRPCSFLQESQRYCRYADDKFGNRVTFIEPMFFKKGSPEYELWEEVMLFTEKRYLILLETSTPQASRTVMPNSCKTEIIVFASLVEWNHIFHMRTSPAAEPSMREVMIPLQKDFCEIFPGFDFNRRFPEDFIE